MLAQDGGQSTVVLGPGGHVDRRSVEIGACRRILEWPSAWQSATCTRTMRSTGPSHGSSVDSGPILLSAPASSGVSNGFNCRKDRVGHYTRGNVQGDAGRAPDFMRDYDLATLGYEETEYAVEGTATSYEL